MEFPSLTHQCSNKNCKKVDFLPLICENCKEKFCTQHFNEHSEHCKILSSDNIIVTPTDPSSFKDNGFNCNFCGVFGMIPIICNKCHGKFCIKHRHFDENCEINNKQIAEQKQKYKSADEKFTKAKNLIDEQITKNLNEAKKGKNCQIARKVLLMKIKSKAKGLKTIPLNDRIYFNILFNEDKSTPVFVSKIWSLGRIIDAISLECNLKNTNNKINGKKLILFKENNEILCENLAETLENLINNNIIVNGDTLIIKSI